MKNPFVSVVLLAGGQGTRLKSALPKQYLHLQGKPMALYSFELMLQHPCVQEIIVVCAPTYQDLFATTLAKPVVFAKPGERRQDSVWEGLQSASDLVDLVCIHDSARPLLSKEDLDAVIEQAAEHKAAALAVPAKNTIKQVDENGFVSKTLDRSTLWEMQTPQVIEPLLLHKGFAKAHSENLTVTDDAALVELLGHPVKLVHGSYRNLKITTAEDLAVAEALLEPACV